MYSLYTGKYIYSSEHGFRCLLNMNKLHLIQTHRMLVFCLESESTRYSHKNARGTCSSRNEGK
jgi:hypothetical protein